MQCLFYKLSINIVFLDVHCIFTAQYLVQILLASSNIQFFSPEISPVAPICMHFSYFGWTPRNFVQIGPNAKFYAAIIVNI